MRLTAGSLRHIIEVQQNAETKDDFGSPISDWSTVCRLRSSVDYINGHATYGTGKGDFNLRERVSTEFIKFRVYHRPTIQRQMRVLYNGDKYRIKGVFHDPFNNVTEITCDLINE